MNSCCKHIDFILIDDCYIVCKDCNKQIKEISGCGNDEFEIEKSGKSRYGIISDTSNVDRKGEVQLDTSLPYEPHTKTSLGSGTIDEISKAKQRRLRIERRIEEEVLQKLIDPLQFSHSHNVVSQIRNTVETMLIELMKDNPSVESDEENDEDILDEPDGTAVNEEDNSESTSKKRKRRSNPKMKNRGFRKNAVYSHLIKRVILRFLPEYNEREYNERILLPYFNHIDYKDIFMKIKKYGVPIFQETFPEFDRNYEVDLQRHLRCKIRNILNDICEKGMFSSVFAKNEQFLKILDFVGNFIFNQEVKCQLQKWDFTTQVGVIICILGISTPNEIVELMKNYDDRCVLPNTINTRMRNSVITELVENAFKNSSEKWKELFDDFEECKKTLITTNVSGT
jgi:hypothetical protein